MLIETREDDEAAAKETAGDFREAASEGAPSASKLIGKIFLSMGERGGKREEGEDRGDDAYAHMTDCSLV